MTSEAGKRSVAKLAADANVILSAVMGRAALRVFTESDSVVVSTESVMAEVREYLPILAEKYDLVREALELQFKLLAVKEYPQEHYESHLEEAERQIGARDPDDVDLLALALDVPVWTNDRDFEITNVARYTTAQLLKALGMRGR
ncbi:PIN domain-containing protein [Planctomycetota bacterium]